MKRLIAFSSFFFLPVALLAQKPAGSNVSGPDRAFAIRVAETDLAEIEVGNMALEKSKDPKVKEIAQKLVEDHTKTSEALKQIAEAKSLPLPQEPDSKHKAIAMKLKAESGEAFDRDFLKANSEDHHKVVAAFEKESQNGNDPEIKEFATKFLPAIKEHTKMIDNAK